MIGNGQAPRPERTIRARSSVVEPDRHQLDRALDSSIANASRFLSCISWTSRRCCCCCCCGPSTLWLLLQMFSCWSSSWWFLMLTITFSTHVVRVLDLCDKNDRVFRWTRDFLVLGRARVAQTCRFCAHRHYNLKSTDSKLLFWKFAQSM